MTTYSYSQLEQLWIQGGGSKATAPIAAAIAMAESSGSETVTSNNPDGGTNVGPWQLDTKGVGSGYTVAQLSNGLTNAQIAVKGSSDGTNWSEWATYASGAYKKFLQGGVSPSAVSTSGSGNTASDVQLTGFSFGADANDATKYLLSPIKFFTNLGSEADDTAKGILDISNDIKRMMDWAVWLFEPSSWLRVGAFFAGMVLLLMGGVTLAKATGAIPQATPIPVPV